MKLGHQQRQYYKEWEVKRKQRWKQIIKEGIFYWALPFSLFLTLFELNDHRFIMYEKIELDFILFFITSLILGVINAFLEHRTTDKKYLELKEKSII